MKKITKRQFEIYSFIKKFLEDNNYPPTRLEIAKNFGFKSANSSEEHIKKLKKIGLIDTIPKSSRGIVIAKSIGIPLLGKIHAGIPIETEMLRSEKIVLDQNFFEILPDYFLKVIGDSMSGIGMMEDDYIAIKKTKEVKNNQIVVARLNNEFTVKKFFYSNKIIKLIPENNKYSEISVDPKKDQFEIEGYVIGLIRKKMNN